MRSCVLIANRSKNARRDFSRYPRKITGQATHRTSYLVYSLRSLCLCGKKENELEIISQHVGALDHRCVNARG